MDILYLIGRILLGGYFLGAGLNHFTRLAGMAAYAQSKGVPFPTLAVAGTGVLLLLGGASILLGFLPQIGAILLLVFLFPVTFWMHRFWQEKDEMAKMNETINFTKNLGLAGALLALLALTWTHGAGPFSLVDLPR
ncbi:MAG: DoxX family protein [Dehalococcoidia bacterium]|nr:DoxX family protein [Dehalococcoidia bacterium]MDW8119861.1 DoxX family protein [Chloroflexota bacterium]